ncbi:hypothetical protein AeMF1_007433, partial [Aphanomyces euteiches]
MSKRVATGKSVPQDLAKEALKAVRASIATADPMRQLLTECVSKSAELADQQKQVQDQLKADSAAGQDDWIDFVRAQATIFRLEKRGGLAPPSIPKAASSAGSTVLNVADSDDEFDPDSTGEPESKKAKTEESPPVNLI